MNGYLLVIAVARRHRRPARRHVRAQGGSSSLGMAAFAAGSVLSGAAGDEVDAHRRAGRAGLGAAAMLPLSLAIVCDAFPASEQARALGIWAAVSAIALAIGPLFGGALVELDWRLIFWINLPIAALGIADHRRARRRESSDPGAGHADRLPGPGHAERRPERRRPGARRGAELGLGRRWPTLGLLGAGLRLPGRVLARSSTGSRTRSSTSRCFATAPTSAPPPPPSPSSAPTGR